MLRDVTLSYTREVVIKGWFRSCIINVSFILPIVNVLLKMYVEQHTKRQVFIKMRKLTMFMTACVSSLAQVQV